MSVKCEWQEDSEALSIAMEVKTKYDETFEGIELGNIRFVRVLGKKGKAIKVTSVGFPFNIDVPYLYYIEINDEKWKTMTEAQRNLLVFKGLYEIAPGGMDPESVDYGKKRKKEVEDFKVVIAAAGGRFDWEEIGVQGVRDILTNDDNKAVRAVADMTADIEAAQEEDRQ